MKVVISGRYLHHRTSNQYAKSSSGELPISITINRRGQLREARRYRAIERIEAAMAVKVISLFRGPGYVRNALSPYSINAK